jgi:hypothetical protein
MEVEIGDLVGGREQTVRRIMGEGRLQRPQDLDP